MKKSLFILALVFFAAFQLTAQTSEQPVDNPNAPVITFDKVVHDYGTIMQNSDGGCEFKFSNDGKEPLILIKAKVKLWMYSTYMAQATDIAW